MGNDLVLDLLEVLALDDKQLKEAHEGGQMEWIAVNIPLESVRKICVDMVRDEF